MSAHQKTMERKWNYNSHSILSLIINFALLKTWYRRLRLVLEKSHTQVVQLRPVCEVNITLFPPNHGLLHCKILHFTYFFLLVLSTFESDSMHAKIDYSLQQFILYFSFSLTVPGFTCLLHDLWFYTCLDPGSQNNIIPKAQIKTSQP